MAWLLSIITCLGGLSLLHAKPSEYQLESEPLSRCESLRGVAVANKKVVVPQCSEDGSFRPVQCSGRGHECWCVDAAGQEIVGTLTNNSALHCPSPCQLQSELRCSPSGQFESIQCDTNRGHCWCVDHDGMELYGTRQNGRPQQCPGSCEVRGRRLLHGASSSMSPPQCSRDGRFLPVQCKFINMTDKSELDLLQAFSRFPESFSTFSSFRKTFPMVSSYCYCSDSRGRELDNTGLELLLSGVDDSAFLGLGSVHSFSQTNVYQVLQRRMLGVRLALTGFFRCPTSCEEERRAATAAANLYVPSCERDGAYTSRQCQQGVQCWCVDATGREIPGTRQLGDSLVCSPDQNCFSRRRLALSQLFSGPVAPSPSLSSSPPASCLSLLRPLQPLLPTQENPTSHLSLMLEVFHGLFPSVGEAFKALVSVSPHLLQEELFGGEFLTSVATFNLSGAVGARGAMELLYSQKNGDLVLSVSRALEDPAFLSSVRQALTGLSSSLRLQEVLTPLLHYCTAEEQKYSEAVVVPSCTSSGAFQEVQCHSGECWCVDSRGQEVTGSRTSGQRPRCPSRCEKEQAAALRVRGSLAAGAELHIPACSENGDFLPLQCVGSRCFCVDAEGKRTAEPSGNALTCAEMKPQRVSGACSGLLSKVTAFREEVSSLVALSRSSHLALGLGVLLAEGLSLTPEELQLSQPEEALHIGEELLSGTRAALRLAAFSTVQMYLRPLGRSYQPYTPQCDADGNWLHTQCHHSTGQCWCVDDDGDYMANSLTSRSVKLPKCPTNCQRAQAHTLLSGWRKSSDVSTTVPPQCDENGRYSLLQTGGAGGSCVNPLTGEEMQTATRNSAEQLTCPTWCQLQGGQCDSDGLFIPLQCDETSCWCVSVDGQEVGGTRTPQETQLKPSCDRPLCRPSPGINHGALLCHTLSDGRQTCELICHHGYHNTLPISSFLCDTESQQWVGDFTPVGGACQISQPLQVLSHSQLFSLSSPCSQISTLQPLLVRSLTSLGLCSMQLPVSTSSVLVCDQSSVHLQCDSDQSLKLTVMWRVAFSDVPTSDLPHLHDIVLFLNESRLLEGVQQLLSNIKSILVSTTPPIFGCSHGYHLTNNSEGCLVCPAGTFATEGACLLCPPGTYQDEEGRSQCSKCPTGSSPAGATSVNQCVTECQKRGMRCSERGDFLSAQPGVSGRWRCLSSEGVELEWTSSDKALTDEECTIFRGFQTVSGSDLILGTEDVELLQTITSDLKGCIQACAAEPSCHHVALFDSQTQCELYSTQTLNTQCVTSQQTKGFLDNPEAEVFDWVHCSVKVRGSASDLLVIRKKGEGSSSTFVRSPMMKAVSGVFKTQMFSSTRTTLTDAYRFCQDGCSRDSCCEGYVLNQINVNGGFHLCGWLSSPSVLMCGKGDWDVIGHGTANRICGAGLTYNEQQKSFLFDFGGQTFNITDSSLPSDSKNKDYQSSIVSFQGIYLNTGSPVSGSPLSCAAAEPSSPLDGTVQQKFRSVPEDDVVVDPHKKLSALRFLLNKKSFNSQHALLWCLTRCDAESLCAVADLTEAETAGFYSCSLFPDTRVCGAYDKPLRAACRLLLNRAPNNAHIKRVELSGPVKSFYQRISFQKFDSYSVRSRVSLGENAPLTQGFRECERRCDEDPCCRGFGFVRDAKSPGGAKVVCVSLLSLGVLTCDEASESSWRRQDCAPPAVLSSPEPFGWFLKPVKQWTSAPALCPEFGLTAPNVSLSKWRLLDESSVLVDPSVSTYDVIHISSDISGDQDKTRNWCLHACQEAESCVAVSLSEGQSGVRCVLYPDTTTCGLSSSPHSAKPTSSCRLLLREPADTVYLRADRPPVVTTVSIPGNGLLQGSTVETWLGSEQRTVVQFLGVPYARPPTSSLRFQNAQPFNWTGTWDATKPRATCLQPGDTTSDSSSEDCLYLNIFSPAARRGNVPVLVFFFNPSANPSPALLHGSTLAAVGNIVVVTASYRTAALGFLSTGDAHLRGMYGLSDQEAVLRWVHVHIALMGGDNSRVTVGAERGGADITSLHLLSSASSLFHRMILMGGSLFSPSSVSSSSSSLVMDLVSELGCVSSDPSVISSCLRALSAQTLNEVQTKLLAVSGPFHSWSPPRQSTLQVPLSTLSRVDLLLGTSEQDGLIGRARRIKDFEALQGRVNGKTAFYEALSRSLGGETGNPLLKEAATWFYSLDHSPTPQGYSLFSRSLNNATRDLFITCPSLQMANFWAKNSQSNVFLYHLPASTMNDRADVFVPLDVQLVFGVPHQPTSYQRFTSSNRRLSLAMMSYVASFVKTGNPNPSKKWAESSLPRWRGVQSFEDSPTYLELSPSLMNRQGLRQRACSFWNHMRTKLSRENVDLKVDSFRTDDVPKSRSFVSSRTTSY